MTIHHCNQQEDDRASDVTKRIRWGGTEEACRQLAVEKAVKEEILRYEIILIIKIRIVLQIVKNYGGSTS